VIFLFDTYIVYNAWNMFCRPSTADVSLDFIRETLAWSFLWNIHILPEIFIFKLA
jgi:hypothetical protein